MLALLGAAGFIPLEIIAEPVSYLEAGALGILGFEI
jgi:hypothetical protein